MHQVQGIAYSEDSLFLSLLVLLRGVSWIVEYVTHTQIYLKGDV